jgi:hypothetical protein
VDAETLRLRAEIARRLKAARWLAGSIRENARGKTGYEVVSLAAEELAQRPGMAENGITATLLGAIERMERYTPPMELRAIREAMGLPEGWFTDPAPVEVSAAGQMARIEDLLSQLAAAAGPPTSEGELGRVARGEMPTGETRRGTSSRRDKDARPGSGG